jgi:polysaccharide pyruvyl transferase WcaK-like protein
MSRQSSLELVHLANFNSTNIGNGALANGLEHTMSEDIERSIRWSREAWDDYTFRKLDFDQTFVDKVNATDGLIVGGAVTFNGRDYNDRTGTRFELPFELWDKLKKPIVFYGLSYRNWPGQVYHHADKLRQMVEKALASEKIIFSVRNDGTKAWLKTMVGIDSDAIIEVPDSAVFVEAHAGDYPEIVNGARNIMVAFNDEDAVRRYDERGAHSRETVIAALVEVLERLAERYPINIILCPHYFDDFKMMSAFIERIKPRLAHQNMVASGLCRVKDTSYFYGRYMRADLAISMRVHSMSPCIGLGVPMVALTTQDRMSDFIARLELQNQAVDAFDPLVAEKLYAKAVYTLDHGADVRDSFARARAKLRDETRVFHQRLDKLFSG